jgi:hypothetical protein
MRKGLIALLAGITSFTSCGPIEDYYIECPEISQEFCISVFDPVCGEDKATYTNSCFACQNVERYVAGECEN